jgi:hypothetical protein
LSDTFSRAHDPYYRIISRIIGLRLRRALNAERGDTKHQHPAGSGVSVTCNYRANAACHDGGRVAAGASHERSPSATPAPAAGTRAAADHGGRLLPAQQRRELLPAR